MRRGLGHRNGLDRRAGSDASARDGAWPLEAADGRLRDDHCPPRGPRRLGLARTSASTPGYAHVDRHRRPLFSRFGGNPGVARWAALRAVGPAGPRAYLLAQRRRRGVPTHTGNRERPPRLVLTRWGVLGLFSLQLSICSASCPLGRGSADFDGASGEPRRRPSLGGRREHRLLTCRWSGLVSYTRHGWRSRGSAGPDHAGS